MRTNRFPSSPGIYIMKDKDRNIIYIGKAKDLRKRIKSYFLKSTKHTPWKLKLIENIAVIEIIETNTEVEAIILETNLIKKHKPKYNILMKDDKNYSYIKITTNEDYPQVYTVRKRLKDNAEYFGPKTGNTRKTLKFLNKIFPYRTCNLELSLIDLTRSGNGDKSAVKVLGKSRKTPCLDYHIKRCMGPCINKISKKDYRDIIDQIIMFLNGKKKKIKDNLESKMIEAANTKNFELAAKIRDQIKSLDNTKQIVSDTSFSSRDIINFEKYNEKFFVVLMQVREGQIINQENFILISNNEPDNEFLRVFIQNYYSETTSFPKEIIIPEDIQDKELLQQWFKEVFKQNIGILVPKKGIKNKLLSLAKKNVASFCKMNSVKWEEDKNTLKLLQALLNLKTIPKRIECYDISHLAGTNTVGSMVVFKNGKPSPTDYRKFKINSLKEGEIDDYKSLYEILLRRLNKLSIEIKKGDKKLPHSKDDPKEYLVAYKKNSILGYTKITKNDDRSLELKKLWFKKDIGKETIFDILRKTFSKFKGKTIYTQLKTDGLLEEFGFKKDKTKALGFKVPKINDSFSTAPDLIIIDGGKGQLSAVSKIAGNYDLISIAKKEEHIFLPDNLTPIILDKGSKVLHLIQRIRDEAHRFAISFNRSKRQTIKSVLDSIPGIGPKIKKKLLTKYGSITGIKDADFEELKVLVGIKLANKIKEL